MANGKTHRAGSAGVVFEKLFQTGSHAPFQLLLTRAELGKPSTLQFGSPFTPNQPLSSHHRTSSLHSCRPIAAPQLPSTPSRNGPTRFPSLSSHPTKKTNQYLRPSALHGNTSISERNQMKFSRYQKKSLRSTNTSKREVCNNGATNLSRYMLLVSCSPDPY